MLVFQNILRTYLIVNSFNFEHIFSLAHLHILTYNVIIFDVEQPTIAGCI